MTAKELANELLKHPDFEVTFQSYFQEYAGGPLIYDSWSNINIEKIVNSNKHIVLTGELN